MPARTLCEALRDAGPCARRVPGTARATRRCVQDNSTIREATPEDLDAIQRLLGTQPAGSRRPEQVALDQAPGRRHFLVLDPPDGGPGLAAAAVLQIEGHRGHLVMLAVAKQFEGCGLEDRMIGVAEALCSAFGADTLDVPARAA